MNPTRRLRDEGQSLWIDHLSRRALAEGRLERLILEDDLRGVTSNPTIFEQAIGGGGDYDPALEELLAADPRSGAGELYERLAVEDIRRAADVLRPVFDESGGDDGYVSLEVSPYLAYDTEATVEEARRLWAAVERPNLMIKVPATDHGIPAIRRLTAEGINVNVTLMFSLADYEAVAGAYLDGLEELAAAGDDAALARVASVASFFVSRVDGKVDPLLEEIGSDEARALLGTLAIANAKLAYRRFQELFVAGDGEGARFARLAERGARLQRVLFGSTSTKNPAYRDVLYVEELIGPHTVNTLPPKTVDAFRDHGVVRATLAAGMDEAAQRVAALGRLGIDLDAITRDLQREGVASFADSFDQLHATLETTRRRMLAARVAGRQSEVLGEGLRAVSERLLAWQDTGFGRRLWAGDRTLWSARPVPELVDRLGWLTLPDAMRRPAADFAAFARQAASETDRVVLLGMGGSSLAPEVFQRVLGNRRRYPALTVLDSTHPAAVRAATDGLDPARTLFVVSSKSGSTTETKSLFHHFWSVATEALGDGAGSRFVAITDPGSSLAELGRERGFARVFEAPPEVGGRYSALSPFGLVPAALVGIDVVELLDRAWAAAFAFGPQQPALLNEALRLGAVMGEMARAGRDKLTLLTTPALAAFPDWLEQLVAESTGKGGTGVVPVVGEGPEAAGRGDDRLYAALLLDGDDAGGELAARLDELERAGATVVRIRVPDRLDLGVEMLRWEIATAAAGAALGVQPFDQPDVQLAKDLAREAIAGAAGRDAEAEPVAVSSAGFEERLAGFLRCAGAGDYVSVHAYLPPDAETDRRLAALQAALGEVTGRAVTVGYGPRFLHSTGQLHKGGPDTGLFLQLVDEPAHDLPVPETDYTFGRLIRGQAEGDRMALTQRNRRVLAVSLGADAGSGLDRLASGIAAGETAGVAS
ncbi:MAG TPA: bifunctional transaldolase/phosoglucose isomerase [Thermoanaerobaculia bacterium]|nr:bifunctional transaldolase/phosoglucose isomerase [Thermoanaerobaculia bacterium]